MGTTVLEAYLNVTLDEFRDAHDGAILAKSAGRIEPERQEAALRAARDLCRSFEELCRDAHTVIVKRERGEPHMIRTVGGLNEACLIIAYSEHPNADVAPNACILRLATEIAIRYKPGLEQVVWTVDFRFRDDVGYRRRDEIRDAVGSATPHAFGVGPPFYREGLAAPYFRVFANDADASTFIQRLTQYSEVDTDSIRLDKHVEPHRA